MEWRGIAHDWILSCKDIMEKNEAEISKLNQIYGKTEATRSVFDALSANVYIQEI